VSLTQWKPDYEGAAELFEQAGAQRCVASASASLARRVARAPLTRLRAAVAYKNSNRKAQAMEAFEKLAYCKEKLGECAPLDSLFRARACPASHARPRRPWLAAKHLEAAGYSAKDSGTASAEEARAQTPLNAPAQP